MGNTPTDNAKVQPNGAEIRSLREKAALYQSELADRAKLSKRTVESVEAGGSCTWKSLKAIAKALGVEPAKLTVAREAGATRGLDASGIVHCHERLERDVFEQLLKASPAGPVVIVNTWIENLRDISDLLVKAMKHDRELTIDLFQLKAEPEITRQRAVELGGDVSDSIKGENQRIKRFLSKLDPVERKRVSVFALDSIPKFSLYAVGDSCLVGFFWPHDTAVSKPQLLVRGRTGFFAQEIWCYLETVRKSGVPISVSE